MTFLFLRKNLELPKADEPEELLLDEVGAVKLAARFGRFDENGEFDDQKRPDDDPLRDEIAPSLLNAGDIKKYVLATGLISPFYQGGGSKSRMKDASYEGRIGEKAYVFKADKNEPTQIFFKGDRVLKVPANSIVFVESDLYFRLPDFIALRFNLQIKHVHRGLLLGTGPLIDPGYWGKLCIPLHNLTDQDYFIPANEGLIWIEFTKTTVIEERIGRPPLGREFKEILPFLDKASRRFDRPSIKVGIRSSIPKAVDDASRTAKEAKTTATNTRSIVFGLGFVGALGALAAIVALFQSTLSLSGNFNSEMQRGFDELRPAISDLEASVSNFANQLEAERTDRDAVEAEMREAREASERQMRVLREGVSILCSSQENEELRQACLSILTEPN